MGPFIGSPARPLISVYFFFVVMWNSKRQHHHDCLVSLILWATLKKLLCDGLCERGALRGRTRTRKVQIWAHISLLPGLTQSYNSLTVSLAILQTKPSQAGFPVRMNTDKWNRNPFWFVFFFRPSTSPTKSPQLVWVPLAGKADGAHVKKQAPPM